MGSDLYHEFAATRHLFQTTNEALGYNLQELMFSGSAEELQLTKHTQPAILTHSVAAWTILADIIPKESIIATAGLSLGEYSALVVAGVLPFDEAVVAVHHRGAAMQAAVPVGVGGMSAILGLATSVVEEIVNRADPALGVVAIANYNSPGQVVISGKLEALAALEDELKAAGASRVVALPVSAPFHCSLLQPAADRLAQVLHEVTVGEFNYPVIANTTALPYPGKEMVKEILINQVTNGVRWEQTVRYLLQAGCDTFVEIGPGTTLSQFVRRIARDSDHQVQLLSCDKVADIAAIKEFFSQPVV